MDSRRPVLSLLAVSVFLAGLAGLAGQERRLPDVLTVKKVVRSMQEAFGGVETYVAGFKISVETAAGSKEAMAGTVKYKRPGRIIFLFDRPEGQLIYSDGQVMRIYLPELRVVGEQKLHGQSQDIMFINSKTSFYQLTRQYNFTFPKESVKTVNGRRIVVLHLTQKNVYAGFKAIDLWVDGKWMIVKAVGRTRENKLITVNFFDIKVNHLITDNEFMFDLPVDVQTIYDPLYQPGQER
jgi:outer membrane lipoprotein-sorting protein